MRFRSTGNRKDIVSAAEALESPIPEPGHLWMPVEICEIEWPDSKEDAGMFISKVVQHFFDTRIHPNVYQPIDLRPHKEGRTHALNLHRGPTKSFKDIGCTSASYIQKKGKVVVATSGDTGSAAAHAFGQRALVLYPASRISAYQERQMLSSEAAVCAVDGDFDDCQRIAKQMIHRDGVGSCNSISLARLLPQIGYFAWAAFQVPRCRLHCSEWKSGERDSMCFGKENGGTHRRCGGGVQRKRLRIVRTRCGWVRLRTQKNCCHIEFCHGRRITEQSGAFVAYWNGRCACARRDRYHTDRLSCGRECVPSHCSRTECGGKVARKGSGGADRGRDKVRGRRKSVQPFLRLSGAPPHAIRKK